MSPKLPLSALCCLALVAHAAPAPKPPQVEKQKIVNISHFDIGSCTAPTPSLPDPLNPESIVGALVLMRPRVLECFVSPKNRGPEADSVATVKAIVSDQGPAFEVTGTNLTAAGLACIEEMVKQLPFKPVEAGSAPVSGVAEYRHGPLSPAVKLGVNSASDLAGAIRLAEPGWCDCWSGLGPNPPPSLQAHLKFVAAKAPEVSFDPTSDPAATALIGCLTRKLAALPPTTGSNELTVHYPFLLVSSNAPQETADAPPDLQFIQLDLIRAQRAADVALKIGARTNALKTYDALVTRYRAKPNPKLIPQLKEKCGAWVASDDQWIAALKAQRELDGRSLSLASALKAKDSRWADAETAAGAKVTLSTADVTKAEGIRVADAAVCPKEHK